MTICMILVQLSILESATQEFAVVTIKEYSSKDIARKHWYLWCEERPAGGYYDAGISCVFGAINSCHLFRHEY